MTNKNIAAIIVTFNASEWIERCIESLLDQKDSALRIIVVDNFSTDNTIEKLVRYGNKIIVIKAPRNVGFGQGNNVGFDKAIALDCEYCFLLNQDAWIEPDCLSKLVDASQDNENAGILSPIHCTYSSRHLQRSFRSYLPEQLRESLPVAPFDVDFVSAAFWMIPVNVLLDVGGFDPVFFMYGEDNDLSQRIQNLGRSIVVVPEAIGHHQEKHGPPSINRLAARYYLKMVNLLRFNEQPILRRYAMTGKNASWSLIKSIGTCKLRRILAIFLSLSWVACRCKQIEASRKSLNSSPSPFISKM